MAGGCGEKVTGSGACDPKWEGAPPAYGDALIEGVELTLKQFVGVLAKFGVTPVDSVGRPFDPATQQAVTQVESATVPEQSVVEEFQKGYLLHDRILRAAMVSVSKGPSADA